MKVTKHVTHFCYKHSDLSIILWLLAIALLAWALSPYIPACAMQLKGHLTMLQAVIFGAIDIVVVAVVFILLCARFNHKSK